MDRVTKAVRSRIMSKIRSKDTWPERIIWDLVRELDEPPERWANMPGKPDFVFDRAGVAVFVDGCFFHRCPVCKPSTPMTNKAFWLKKFAGNQARDKRVNQMLNENGWLVLRFWECHIKHDPDDVIYVIESTIEERLRTMEDVRAED